MSLKKYFYFIIYLYTYKTLIILIVCLFVCVFVFLRPCVHSKILGLIRPVMIVSNLDTIEFIFY